MHRLKNLLRKKSTKSAAKPPESAPDSAATEEEETPHTQSHSHNHSHAAKGHVPGNIDANAASPLRVSVPVSTATDDDVSPATPADVPATATTSAPKAPHARPPSPAAVAAAATAGVVEPRGRQRSGAFYDAAPPIIGADGSVRLATPPLPRPATAFRVTTGAARLPDGVSWSLRFAVGVADTVGRRAAMEDAHAVLGRFGGVPMRDLFLVCDGHNGPAAARAVSSMLPEALLTRLNGGAGKEEEESKDKEGKQEETTEEEEALKGAFVDVNERLREEGVAGGTTATAVLVDVGAAFVASVGDTRCALVQGGVLTRLTRDHRPADAAEAAAVVARGGTVDAVGRELRVNGTLAITRALGDRELAGAVSPVPDVRRFVFDFEPGSAIIIACDGLWDVVSFVSLVTIVITLVLFIHMLLL